MMCIHCFRTASKLQQAPLYKSGQFRPHQHEATDERLSSHILVYLGLRKVAENLCHNFII